VAGAGLERLEAFLERLAASGWRGLAVAAGFPAGDVVELVRGFTGGDCLLVAPSRLRGGSCRVEVSPARVQDALGGEFSAAVLAVEGLLRPSIVAAAGETVRGGGALVIASEEEWGSWDPGPREGRGLYAGYLKRRILEAPIHLVVDRGGFVSESWRPPEGAPPRRGLEGFRSRVGVPRGLQGLARTRDQLDALERLASFLRGRGRSVLLTGDRGRGKSFTVGLAIALAIYWHVLGRAVVVAPTPRAVESLMRGVRAGLEALGVLGRRGVRVVESKGLIVRFTGPWFRVSYEPPDTAEYAPLMVVDEAASLGLARVRRLTWRSGKSIVSTTIHGYEGSGRAFARLLPRVLPRPMERVELSEPIRYNPGDPLEAWLYETFLLKAEPGEPPGGPVDPGRAEHRVVAPEELAGDRRLLGEAYGVLVQAHYRNTPDDLLLLLEAPHHHLHILTLQGRVVAVADVVDEDSGVPGEARIALDRLLLHLPGEPPSGVTAQRVSRIAVHPELQGRGLGSRLLRGVEEWSRARGRDLVTTIFGRHDVIGFWLKAGYKPYYVSPRFNKVTGEKNVAMAKPLTGRGEELLREASRSLTVKLLTAAASVYRDLAAEKVAELLGAAEPVEPWLPLLPHQERGLSLYLEGRVEAEQVMDAVWAATVNALASRRPLPLAGRELVAVIARIVQGKPYSDVAAILGVAQEEAVETVNSALRRMLRQEWESNAD